MSDLKCAGGCGDGGEPDPDPRFGYEKYSNPKMAVNLFQVGRSGKHAGYFVVASSPEEALEIVRVHWKRSKLSGRSDFKVLRIINLAISLERGILRF